ncbi:MAG: cation:proton antiporter, partial [Gemmatimonadetes bacterium]|nr:cation:proton antiporter [Gemmatimonadota bacterium]
MPSVSIRIMRVPSPRELPMEVTSYPWLNTVVGGLLTVAVVLLVVVNGAFLAGVLLAESSYRHQIETDIEPFRGLLLGLFFILIGARLNLDVIVDQWMTVLGGAFGLVLVKAGLLYGLSRAFGARHEDALLTGAVLSQGGEFG